MSFWFSSSTTSPSSTILIESNISSSVLRTGLLVKFIVTNRMDATLDFYGK
jgi:hypothetical protein